MNSGLTSHQQRGHTEMGPRFKVSSERPENEIVLKVRKKSLITKKIGAFAETKDSALCHI